jgi:hypothetical protein
MAWGRQAPLMPTRRQLLPAGRSNETAGRPNASQAMTFETTSPRRLRRQRAPPSLVQELDRVYTQKPSERGCYSKMAPSAGGVTPEGATAIPPESLVRAFAQSDKPRYSRSPRKADITIAAA